jgi:putative flippase GtrA
MSVHFCVPERSMAWLRSRFHQLVRYAGVSAISTTTSLVTLALGMTVLGLGAVWANLMATAIGTVPSFELNRRWVWRCADRRSLAGQIVPFTALSFTGLGLSTLTVHLAASATARWSTPTRTLAVELASVIAYGSLWVVQFVLLDRLLFHRRSDALPAGSGRLVADSGARPLTDTGALPDTGVGAVAGDEPGTVTGDGAGARPGVGVDVGLRPEARGHQLRRSGRRVDASVFDAA